MYNPALHKKQKKEKQYEPSGRCCDFSARLKGRDGTDSGNKYIFVIDEGYFGILWYTLFLLFQIENKMII